MRAICFQVVLVVLFSPFLESKAIGTVTFTLPETELHIVRGASVFVGVQGALLNVGDMLETGARGLTQLEFSPGSVVALGPSSKLLLFSYSGAATETQAEFVLLSGWLKGEIDSKSGAYQFDTPLLAGMSKQGSLVVRAGADSSDVFVESGTARVAQVTAAGGVSQFRAVKAGEFFSRRAGKDVTAVNRPAAAFVDSMPVPFRDTLPSHPIKGKSPALGNGREIEYAQLHPWLRMPPRWRKELVTRFQSRLSDPSFREELEAHLQEYPEWDPVLHPEKYPNKNQ
jgi:hypothetical protein